MTPKRRIRITLITLTIIYLFAEGFAVTLAPINAFTADESPFVLAMNRYGLGFFPHVFNGGIIIAGFSTMSASLFAVERIF